MKYLIISLLLVSYFTHAQNRKFESFQSETGKTYAYVATIPVGYSSENTYPVLLGPGDGTKNSDKSFFWNIEDPEQFGWILIEFTIWKEDPKVVAELLDHLNTVYHVENKKFHMVGFSANSANTFKIGLQIPQYFTSITGIPGHPRTNDEKTIKKLKGLKIQNIVGENDGYWLKSAEEFDALYGKLGINHTLDIIPNGGHVLRELVGSGFMQRMERMR